MRPIKEVNEAGIVALVRALGKEDARRFLAQFGSGTSSAGGDGGNDEEAMVPLTIEEAHQSIRDMQDPMEQQHML